MAGENNKTTITYCVFLYREAMQRAKDKTLKLSKAKYLLTTGLVDTTLGNLTSYSKEERSHLIDSMVYKKKLMQQINKKS